MQCPCCSNKLYTDCCGRFIEENKRAATPEELMRSRYTAYTQANIDYIMKTMLSPAADGFNAEEAKEWAKRVTWKKLEVVSSKQDATYGMVEFIAHFTDNGQEEIVHEISDFHLEKDHWYYVDGKIPSPNKRSTPASATHIGRNEPCPCGSSKKYKKCCGK